MKGSSTKKKTEMMGRMHYEKRNDVGKDRMNIRIRIKKEEEEEDILPWTGEQEMKNIYDEMIRFKMTEWSG